MMGADDVTLAALRARVQAAAGDLDALEHLDGLLAGRPEPEARKLRFKIGSLRRAARQVVDRVADVAANGSVGVCEKAGLRVLATKPVACRPAREAARVPAGPWRALLAASGLERPDGRPLHRYRLDEGSFLDLHTFVRERGRRGLDQPESDLPALFVLWAAHSHVRHCKMQE